MNSVYIDSAVPSTPIYIGPNNANSIIVGNATSNTTVNGLLNANISTNNIDIAPAGTLNIGSSITTGTLTIGQGNVTTGSIYIGSGNGGLHTGPIVIGTTGTGSSGTATTIQGGTITIDSSPGGTINVGMTQTAASSSINIGGNTNRLGPINIGGGGSGNVNLGNANSITTSLGTIKCNNYDTNNNSSTGPELLIGHSVTQNVIRIGESVTTGTIVIGNGTTQNGTIAIGSSGSSARTIIIGSSESNSPTYIYGNVTINRPLTLGSAPTANTMLGYSSSASGNPILPSGTATEVATSGTLPLGTYMVCGWVGMSTPTANQGYVWINEGNVAYSTRKTEFQVPTVANGGIAGNVTCILSATTGPFRLVAQFNGSNTTCSGTLFWARIG